VSVISTPDDGDTSLVEDFIIPAPAITHAVPATIYVSFSRLDPAKFDIANFTNTLRFTSKEVDPDTGEPEEQGYDDEYEVDVLTLGSGDYFLPTYIGNFQGTWDSFGGHNDVSDTFALSSMKSIPGMKPSPQLHLLLEISDFGLEATKTLIDLLSLQPLEGTDQPSSPSMHTMKLSGRTISGAKVVAMAKMVFSQRSGVTLKLSARSQDEGAAQLVLDAIV
jgi:coatomer subunit gamma